MTIVNKSISDTKPSKLTTTTMTSLGNYGKFLSGDTTGKHFQLNSIWPRNSRESPSVSQERKNANLYRCHRSVLRVKFSSLCSIFRLDTI